MKRAYFLLFLVFIGCSSDKEVTTISKPPELLDAIVSSSVAFSYTGDKLDAFFEEPSLAYVSGYFYFEDNLAEDIVFGLDIELLEGLNTPKRFQGADWMALAGFKRNGQLWFPVGYPENLEGTPTDTDNWVIKDFGVTLQPDTWYKMTTVCNFATLEFVSVRLEGGDIDKEMSLSGYPLEYPNYAPFDKASLTAYTFAIRGKEFAPENKEGFNVFFDDIEMGIIGSQDSYDVVFFDGFENQTAIGDIPISSIPISLDLIPENKWYLENEDAKLDINSDVSKTGQKSLRCSANLIKPEGSQ